MVCWKDIVLEQEIEIKKVFREAYEAARNCESSQHVDIYINDEGIATKSCVLSQTWYQILNSNHEIKIGEINGWCASDYIEYDLVENILNNEYDYLDIQREFSVESEKDDLTESDFIHWLESNHPEIIEEYNENFIDWLFSDALYDTLNSMYENALSIAEEKDRLNIQSL